MSTKRSLAIPIGFLAALGLWLSPAALQAQTERQAPASKPAPAAPPSAPAPAATQPAPAPAPDPSKALAGSWELSNADRDMRCAVVLKATSVRAGFALEWDKACGGVFPITKEVTSWMLAKNDSIQFLDSKGRILLELTELETGLYEGLRPGDPLYFLQNQASLGTERAAKDLAGDWGIVRGSGRSICVLTLTDKEAGADQFALAVKPGCDAAITAFSPRAWQLDRGQLVIHSTRGEVWRFEEEDDDTWQRIPAGRQPVFLVKQ